MTWYLDDDSDPTVDELRFAVSNLPTFEASEHAREHSTSDQPPRRSKITGRHDVSVLTILVAMAVKTRVPISNAQRTGSLGKNIAIGIERPESNNVVALPGHKEWRMVLRPATIIYPIFVVQRLT